MKEIAAIIIQFSIRINRTPTSITTINMACTLNRDDPLGGLPPKRE